MLLFFSLWIRAAVAPREETLTRGMYARRLNAACGICPLRLRSLSLGSRTPYTPRLFLRFRLYTATRTRDLFDVGYGERRNNRCNAIEGGRDLQYRDTLFLEEE